MCGEDEKKRKYDERLTLALENLQSVADNKLVPRNIRRVAQDSIATLHNSELSVAVKAANAVSMLEEISTDHNLPSFGRVAIWSAISNLEGIKD